MGDRQAIGVTSTRTGLTIAQADEAARLLGELCAAGATELHSGDCIGGDEHLQQLAHNAWLKVVTHPGPGSSWRAYGYSDHMLPAQDFAVRNQAIVDASSTLLGFPPTDHELQRSGTWQTIRMGRRAGIRVVVVGPTGQVVDTPARS